MKDYSSCGHVFDDPSCWHCGQQAYRQYQHERQERWQREQRARWARIDRERRAQARVSAPVLDPIDVGGAVWGVARGGLLLTVGLVLLVLLPILVPLVVAGVVTWLVIRHNRRVAAAALVQPMLPTPGSHMLPTVLGSREGVR